VALEQGDVLKDRVPFRVSPMLATLVSAPFHRPGWVYEEKYDGYRIVAYKEGARVTLLSRNAKEKTAAFADVAHAVARLRHRTLLLDGEVAGFDEDLVSRFQLLQQGNVPLAYMVFDCLYVDGRDLRQEPLSARRAALEKVIDDDAPLFCSRRLAHDGHRAYDEAKERGFEGIIGKDAAAPYVEARSTSWLKVKVRREEEFVIGGYTPPGGSRMHFGALLLGAYGGGALRYIGKVGTGFTHELLVELHRKFQPLVQTRPAFVDPPREKGAVWLAPRLVAQIAFQEWTSDLKLRQPSFLGLRDDKRPEECLLPATA
jgi:bifunctional non-homologous end joining protein LigD